MTTTSRDRIRATLEEWRLQGPSASWIFSGEMNDLARRIDEALFGDRYQTSEQLRRAIEYGTLELERELDALRAEVRRLPLAQLRTSGGQEVGINVAPAILPQYDYPHIAALLKPKE